MLNALGLQAIVASVVDDDSLRPPSIGLPKFIPPSKLLGRDLLILAFGIVYGVLRVLTSSNQNDSGLSKLHFTTPRTTLRNGISASELRLVALSGVRGKPELSDRSINRLDTDRGNGSCQNVSVHRRLVSNIGHRNESGALGNKKELVFAALF